MPAPSGHVVTATEFGPVVTSATNASVSNTTSELAIMTYTIPANSVSAGDVFPFEMNGHCDITGTPTISFRIRIGGVAGTQLALVTFTAAANTGRPWSLWGRLRCVSTGVSGTWHGFLNHLSRIAGGASPGNAAPFQDNTLTAQTKDTTVNEDLVITAQWSVASASNTLVWHDGEIAKRLG